MRESAAGACHSRTISAEPARRLPVASQYFTFALLPPHLPSYAISYFLPSFPPASSRKSLTAHPADFAANTGELMLNFEQSVCV